MIIGIGIDSVEIGRFSHWHNFSQKQLERIFSPQEIRYCLELPKKSAERFAIRFAAREACYKALNSWFIKPMPFLTFCKYIIINKSNNGAPEIIVNWSIIEKQISIHTDQSIQILASFTHTQTCATAFVVCQQTK